MKKQKDTIYQMNYTLYWDEDGNGRDSYQEAKENSPYGGDVQVVRKGTRVFVKRGVELKGNLLDEFEGFNTRNGTDDKFALISVKYGYILMTMQDNPIGTLVI